MLEGESGANDPVGIALMSSLIAAGALSAHAVGSVAVSFVLQMVVGAAVGYVGGRLLLWFMQRVRLPGEGLYSLRTMACAGILFAVATVAHGSGFLAVFLAGIVIGDEGAPHKRAIASFHSVLASLAEIVAFVVLGLTVEVDVLRRAERAGARSRAGAWWSRSSSVRWPSLRSCARRDYARTRSRSSCSPG